jgi:hypothetical protein
MHLLIKGGGHTGLAAHIADINGRPLCKTQIKLCDWQISELLPTGIIVCRHCREIEPHKECVLWKDRSGVS